MYTEFYGFKERPFSLIPDPAFLYLSKQHDMALTMLNYSLESRAGITVITGEVGSGKTTLIRQILQHMHEDVSVGLISNARSSTGELLQWVLMAFGLDATEKDPAILNQIFSDFIIKEYADNKRTVLIIDEAQNLDIKQLEELRLLSNINFDKHLVLQLILIGQPELLYLLQKPELRQLVQRVSVDYQLKALKYKETIGYIQHRLTVVGGDPDLFTKSATAVVFYHSRGIPRLINTLCDYALVYGFAAGVKQINLDLMMDVVRDKQQGGIFPMPYPEQESKEAAQIRAIIKKQRNIDLVLKVEEAEDDEIHTL